MFCRVFNSLYQIKSFLSNENKLNLSSVDNVVDYSNWKKIKERIDKV